MDSIHLPWVDPGETASFAVGRLIALRPASGATAVVTVRRRELVILRAEELILAARQNPDMPVSAVPVAAAGIMLPKIIGEGGRQSDFASFESKLDEAGAPFGAFSLSEDMFLVVTRHEYIAAGFRGDLDACHCPNGHVLYAGEIEMPGKCNFCGSSVDCG